MTAAVLPKAIRDQLESLDDLHAKTMSFVGAVLDAERVVASSGLEGDSRVRISIGVGPHVLQGALIHFDNPSKDDILKVRREMASLGYRVKSVDDCEDYRRRTYDCGDIKLLCLFWNFDGEPRACEYKQTGTKEVPVYELVCEDGETVGADAGAGDAR